MQQHHPLEAKEASIDTPPIDTIEEEAWIKAPEKTRLLIWKHYVSPPPFDVLLTTESPHPKTRNLSHLAQTNLQAACETLQEVDLDALTQLSRHKAAIEEISTACFDTLVTGASIRMSGCGAAARAALVAEKLFREAFPDFASQVSTMPAGGDLVAIRAAEGFEDRADYGVRQLQESRFCEQDLYIGVSASGGAAFVHGGLKHVIAHPTARQPIFLICNSIEECLHRFSQDEKTIFSKINELKKVNILSLSVGPMALAGSTRMQAATVQLFALGVALLQAGQRLTEQPICDVSDLIDSLCASLKQMPISTLVDLTRKESQAYVSGDYVIYKASPENALTIATDTTERSPTFNQNYFENLQEDSPPSLCRVAVKGVTGNEQALKALT